MHQLIHIQAVTMDKNKQISTAHGIPDEILDGIFEKSQEDKNHEKDLESNFQSKTKEADKTTQETKTFSRSVSVDNKSLNF